MTDAISTGAAEAGTAAGVSVVLPAFNAAERIERTTDALRAELQPLSEHLEFIIVDDGSSDETTHVGREIRRKHPDVRVLRNRTNLGKGLAVYVGVLASRYNHVCFTDADLAFAPGSYARVVSHAVQGDHLVVASRRLPTSEIQVQMDVLGYASRRYLIGVAFNRLVRSALGIPHADTQCGLKAFSRKVGIELFRRLRCPGFLFDIELFLAARALGTAVEEVPVHVVYRDLKTSVRLAGDAGHFLADLGRVWRRDRAGEYAIANPEMAPGRVWLRTEEVDGA